MIAGSRHHGRHVRAFTLVELLVASLMATFIAGAVISSISHGARARTASEGRLQAASRANVAVVRIADDLRTVVRDHDLYFATIRIDQGAADGGDELLLFHTALRRLRAGESPSEGDQREVQYRLELDPEDDARTLWRREDPVPDEVRDGGGVATPIAPQVTTLRVEAFDGVSWLRVWDTDFDGFPQAVRVTVTAQDDKRRYKTTRRTVVAIDRVPRPFDVLLDEHLEDIGAEPAAEEAS